MNPPFKPESIESLSARFPAAIAEQMSSPADERALDPKHFFDFDDGYRLHIARDRGENSGEEVVLVIGGRNQAWPLTLVIARTAINFAAISGGGYGDPILTDLDGNQAILVYKDPR